MEALRWRLEAETGILRRPAPIPLHPLEVQDPLRIRAQLEQGLQALWRERADVLKGEKLSDDALKVLWRLLQAARSGEPYRQLPAQREGVALRTLLDATVLPLLSGPLQLCPPVGDLRYGDTLILLSLSDTGTFPHSHWQMTAAAFVLDTVFGEGELEQITWLYPRRQATISFHPDALFEFGRGRAVGRDFRRQLVKLPEPMRDPYDRLALTLKAEFTCHPDLRMSTSRFSNRLPGTCCRTGDRNSGKSMICPRRSHRNRCSM
ncbi:hypothetical protein [Deinococcus alpinitundrae]|uniref:hypothetical protein n=1 Tax=Deinococcus alpinitundrae TaxID=468913 RepID=UPI001ED95B08|nr:hypothetical protein [Deinococcus alpinitundrae]